MAGLKGFTFEKHKKKKKKKKEREKENDTAKAKTPDLIRSHLIEWDGTDDSGCDSQVKL